MAILVISVGLDYHVESIRVCIMNEGGDILFDRNCPNSVEAVGERILKFGHPKVVAIEACCGAADFAESLQEQYQFEVRLAHPGCVRKLKQSPDKSDCDDAYLLADLARVNYLPEVWLAPAATRQLRRLVRYRNQLKHTRTHIKQQIRGLLHEERVAGAPANPWTKAWLTWLKETAALGPQARWVLSRQLERLEVTNEAIEEADKRLSVVTADDRLTQKLLEQSGIGPVTAAVLRAEIGTFERFRNGKHLARYCGVTPCNASSGKRESDAGLVRAANRELRSVILQSAHRLARHDPRWRQLKERLKRSKPGSVAAAAVANRWIRWLYHQMVAAQRGWSTAA